MSNRFLLRTSYRQCGCGQRHTSVELFEVQREGQTGLERRIPWREATLPKDAAVKVETKTFPIAVCPVCVFARFEAQSNVPIVRIPEGVRAIVQENMWKHPTRSKLRDPKLHEADAAPAKQPRTPMGDWEFQRSIKEFF